MAPLRTRVEVNDLPAPDQFRPVQHTVDTYAAPEKPIDTWSNTERLGKALMGFSDNLATVVGKLNKGQNDPRIADAYRIMSSANDQEMIQGLQQGTHPWANVPHIRALYEADAGQRAGRQIMYDLQVGAKSGSIPLVDDNGAPLDTQTMIAGRAKDYMFFPQSQHFMKSFQSTIEAGRGNLDTLQRDKVAEVNRERTSTLVKSSLEDVVRMASGGTPDEQLREEITKRTALAGQVAGLRPNEVDQLWVGRLRELATTNPETAAKLLTLDRGRGKDGQPIGSIAGNPTLAKDVREIMTEINNERGKRYDIAQRDEMIADAQKRLAAGDGSFNHIISRSYVNPFAANDPSKDANRTVAKSEVQDAALSRFMQASDAELRRQGLDPAASPAAAETKFRREYEAFVNANRPHPYWQATLQTAGRVLTNPASLSDPRNQQAVEQAYNLYNTLYARNPAYVTETLGLGDRERRFYDHMRVYQQVMGEPTQEAARKAAEYVNNPPPPLTGEETKKVRDELKKLDLNGWQLGGKIGSWFGDSIKNDPTLRSNFEQAVQAIAADRRVPIDKAIEAAAERISSRMVLFNGQAIPTNAYLTNDNAKHYQTRLGEIFKDNEQVLKKVYDVSSPYGLSLRQEGQTGVFRVVTDKGETVSIPQKRPDGSVDYSPLRVFPRDIDNIRVQFEKEREANIMKQQSKNAVQAVIDTPQGRIGGPTAQQRDDAIVKQYEDQGLKPPRLDAKPSDNEPALNYRQPKRGDMPLTPSTAAPSNDKSPFYERLPGGRRGPAK